MSRCPGKIKILSYTTGFVLTLPHRHFPSILEYETKRPSSKIPDVWDIHELLSPELLVCAFHKLCWIQTPENKKFTDVDLPYFPWHWRLNRYYMQGRWERLIFPDPKMRKTHFQRPLLLEQLVMKESLHHPSKTMLADNLIQNYTFQYSWACLWCIVLGYILKSQDFWASLPHSPPLPTWFLFGVFFLNKTKQEK